MRDLDEVPVLLHRREHLTFVKGLFQSRDVVVVDTGVGSERDVGHSGELRVHAGVLLQQVHCQALPCVVSSLSSRFTNGRGSSSNIFGKHFYSKMNFNL